MWRNEYLAGAQELRHGVPSGGKFTLAHPDMLSAMTVDMLLDHAGIRLNGPKAWSRTSSFNWIFEQADGTQARYAVRLSNGALMYTLGKPSRRSTPQ